MNPQLLLVAFTTSQRLGVVAFACLGILGGLGHQPAAASEVTLSAYQNANQAKTAPDPAFDPELVTELVAAAKTKGDPRQGATVFRSPQFACTSCHKVGNAGGIIGPDLSKVGICLTPELITE